MTALRRCGLSAVCVWIVVGVLGTTLPVASQDPPPDSDSPAEAPGADPEAGAGEAAANGAGDGGEESSGGGAGGGTPNTTETAEGPFCGQDDCRPNFQASIFFGSAIDNFAAQNLQDYLNPDATGQTDVFERLIGGVDFAYRLIGDPDEADSRQVWVYGGTVHGVRSTDIDCQANPSLFVCQQQLERPEIDDFDDQFLFALRQASSLEAALGLRWEFRQLQRGAGEDDRTSARLFVSLEAGFVTVSGDDDDVLDDHMLGFGAIATNGRFEGSYLKIGYGPSDYFEVNPDNRWKLDALLSWAPEVGPISFFAEITVNVDGGNGADSIQSYFGFDLNFSELDSLWGGGNGGGNG